MHWPWPWDFGWRGADARQALVRLPLRPTGVSRNSHPPVDAAGLLSPLRTGGRCEFYHDTPGRCGLQPRCRWPLQQAHSHCAPGTALSEIRPPGGPHFAPELCQGSGSRTTEHPGARAPVLPVSGFRSEGGRRCDQAGHPGPRHGRLHCIALRPLPRHSHLQTLAALRRQRVRLCCVGPSQS